jgi:hypothetical protein
MLKALFYLFFWALWASISQSLSAPKLPMRIASASGRIAVLARTLPTAPAVWSRLMTAGCRKQTSRYTPRADPQGVCRNLTRSGALPRARAMFSGKLDGASTMNWRRGLFRAWVVFATCWAGVVGGYGLYNWYTIHGGSFRSRISRTSNAIRRTRSHNLSPRAQRQPWTQLRQWRTQTTRRGCADRTYLDS